VTLVNGWAISRRPVRDKFPVVGAGERIGGSRALKRRAISNRPYRDLRRASSAMNGWAIFEEMHGGSGLEFDGFPSLREFMAKSS
jgi:hypothetical protein